MQPKQQISSWNYKNNCAVPKWILPIPMKIAHVVFAVLYFTMMLCLPFSTLQSCCVCRSLLYKAARRNIPNCLAIAGSLPLNILTRIIYSWVQISLLSAPWKLCCIMFDAVEVEYKNCWLEKKGKGKNILESVHCYNSLTPPIGRRRTKKANVSWLDISYLANVSWLDISYIA